MINPFFNFDMKMLFELSCFEELGFKFEKQQTFFVMNKE